MIHYIYDAAEDVKRMIGKVENKKGTLDHFLSSLPDGKLIAMCLLKLCCNHMLI